MNITDNSIEGRLIPYFQPIFGWKDNVCSASYYEIIARFQLANGTILSPGQFIGMHVSKRDLDFEMLKMLPHIQHKYHSATFSLNASPKNICDESYFELLKTLCLTREIDASRLVIELIEDGYHCCSELNMHKKIMDIRKSLKIRIAIDDFGSGENNLDRIVSTGFDILKISGKLNLTNPKSFIIVAEIVKLLNLIHEDVEIVIEGIENNIQFDRARLTGAKHFQGYLLGMPEPCIFDNKEQIETKGIQRNAALEAFLLTHAYNDTDVAINLSTR